METLPWEATVRICRGDLVVNTVCKTVDMGCDSPPRLQFWKGNRPGAGLALKAMRRINHLLGVGTSSFRYGVLWGMWKNIDPREDLEGRNWASIVILRPNPQGWRQMEAGVGYVEMKYGWHILTSFSDHPMISDKWDEDWRWALAPV